MSIPSCNHHLASEHPTQPGPLLCALPSLSSSGVGLSLLGCGLLGGGYASVGESVQPVRGKARAWVGSDVSGLQQFINQVIAFASARVHAYADCRSTHLHVWGGVPKDLPSHVLQHPKGLLAHLLNILLHGLCTGSLDSTVTGRGSALAGASWPYRGGAMQTFTPACTSPKRSSKKFA